MWQEERRAAVEERRQRSGEQLTFLAAQKELQAAAAELERQQMVVPSTVIGARASAQRLREENERAQREALRAHSAAQAANGEMVGAIGAESIGEPCTQLTLNTVSILFESSFFLSL